MILSILLGGLAYILLGHFKKKREREELYGGRCNSVAAAYCSLISNLVTVRSHPVFVCQS